MKVIYILNSNVLHRTNVCTKLSSLSIYTSMALLIEHSLNTILLGYLYVTQMFITVLTVFFSSEPIYKHTNWFLKTLGNLLNFLTTQYKML